MTTKTFSIITITKNNREGLRLTGQSINEQTCRDWEWVIIDGDSSDGTKDDIKNYKASTVSEPDQGIYDAMNKGIERATGDYVVFMNAGDTFATPMALGFVQKETATKPDFIYGATLELDNGTTTAKPSKSWQSATQGMFTHHQAMFYRRECIGNLRYDTQYKIAADYDFTLRFLINRTNVIELHHPICVFQAGGTSHQNATQGRLEEFLIRDRLAYGSYLNNVITLTRQSCAWSLRKYFPKLYWKLKSAA